MQAQARATWGNASGVPITGGGTWTSTTLDTDRGLVYVPVGNPGPHFATQVREGANLYTNSILVLEAKTGIYRTHYSLVPADFHDWDLAAAPVLVTTKARSQEHTSAPPSPTRRSSALDPRPGGEHRHLPDALLPRSRRFSRLGSRCGSSPRHYQS